MRMTRATSTREQTDTATKKLRPIQRLGVPQPRIAWRTPHCSDPSPPVHPGTGRCTQETQPPSSCDTVSLAVIALTSQ